MSMEQNDLKIQIIPTFTTKMVVVQKRSGETVPFDVKKIYEAIKKAVAVTHEVSDEQIADITRGVLARLEDMFADKTPGVEAIQDSVVKTLMDAKAYKTAEAYIIYRKKRTEIRESYVDAVDIIEGYVGGSNWRIKENANIGYSIGGLILRTSERVTAEYWLNLYPKEVAMAHKNAAFHIHDLGWLTGYCAGWSLRELLYEGFNGVPGYLQCEPAKHMATAISHMVNFLGTLRTNLQAHRRFRPWIHIWRHTYVLIIWTMQMLKTQCRHWCLTARCRAAGEHRHRLLTLLLTGPAPRIYAINIRLSAKST